jgi:hypothetical protein
MLENYVISPEPTITRRFSDQGALAQTSRPQKTISCLGKYFEPHLAGIGHYWRFVPESPHIRRNIARSGGQQDLVFTCKSAV